MSSLTKYGLRFVSESSRFRMTVGFAALLAFAAPGPANAQDAKTILQTMMKTYRAMTSYQGRSSVDHREILTNGRILINDSFGTILSYQKPNKLKLEFTMPSGGRTIYYDGAMLSYFQNRSQTYSMVPVKAAGLKELTDPLLRFQVGSKLDTLYFLAGKEFPSSVSGLKRLPDSTRNGRPVYVV